ncbi:MAG: hypothetical protein KJ648_07445 [Candidatus Omnitrophica bacterium]|nr:hypothetical protein [Candidatus Omnitrophota bacterium]
MRLRDYKDATAVTTTAAAAASASDQQAAPQPSVTRSIGVGLLVWVITKWLNRVFP